MTKKAKKKYFIKDIKALAFLLPFTIFYLIFTIWPVVQGIIISLHDWGLMGKQKFIGLDHYNKMMQDEYFWEALWNTTKFVLYSTPLLVIMALILALIANQESSLKKFYRVSFFMPNILSVAVVSYIAVVTFGKYMGFANMLLKGLGFSGDISWLADPSKAWFVIVILTMWWTVGFNMLVYLSALQEIPEQLYEAAEIDGSTGWEKFWYITLPMLRSISTIIILLQIIASFKVFGQIWLVTKGGPGTATRPLIQYIYETGFKKNNLGYASAMSYALFLILLVLSIIQMKLNKKEVS
ncbi:MAG: ABC transmembrane type-1 domain-containing protein [Xylanivirga thermophila]|uniref:carbohydrate ABC transporter permease n=1 Tax=Xylanivirga thermophila TaxID=2496273 RepID=UPI0039F6043A